eukprot:s1_g91.t1
MSETDREFAERLRGLEANRDYHNKRYEYGIMLTMIAGLASIIILLFATADSAAINAFSFSETTTSSRVLDNDQSAVLANAINRAKQSILQNQASLDILPNFTSWLSNTEGFLKATSVPAEDRDADQTELIDRTTSDSLSARKMVASFFALYRWYESEDAPRDADLIDRWRNIVGKIEPVPDSELSEPPVQRLWMLVDSIHESEKRYASILDEISVAREWEAARRTELSAKLSEDNQVVSSLTSVIDTFGQARPADTGPVAIANALIRIGAVGLTIFIIQILLSFTRYHLRMADHFRGAITALQISDGDVDKALKVAELTSNSVDFGKVPQSVLEKAIDALKESASFRRV